MTNLEPTARRASVEQRLRELGTPLSQRMPPPPEGRLGVDEQPTGRLRDALAELGPVFADFGRYLSSRLDLLPRRTCVELASVARMPYRVPSAEIEAVIAQQLGAPADERFIGFEREPHDVGPWLQRHHAWLPSGVPVTITVVRPDADRLVACDLPLLTLVAPWLDVSPERLTPAIDDFGETLRRRLDLSQLAEDFFTLEEDADAGGALQAPRCYPEASGRRVITTERVAGVTLADVAEGTEAAKGIDREGAAKQLALAWLRQATTGRVVPVDFDLHDLRLCDGHVVMVAGVFEPIGARGRDRLLHYLVAASADDPDAAWPWIEEGAVAEPASRTAVELKRRLRQVVPFRDSEWSGAERLAEHMLVQWRAAADAGWRVRSHELRIYRGIHAVAAASEQLARHHDTLLAALHRERLRSGLTEAQRLLTSDRLSESMVATARHALHVPQKLEELLDVLGAGQLRVKAEVPDSGENRDARNRTVSLVASLVTLVALAFMVRHLAPAYGPAVEWVGAVLVLAVGGWLLSAASRL